ncbi:MAG: glycosyltransferase family 2 protein [Bdellovibrionales bacterium]|nr:glycosyltransferase family 2 protein [Bdellovibrionales bacterium]
MSDSAAKELFKGQELDSEGKRENDSAVPYLHVVGAAPKGLPAWRQYVNSIIASEVSNVSRYMDVTVQWKRREEDTGALLAALDCEKKFETSQVEALEKMNEKEGLRSLVLLNANINHDYNIEDTLAGIRKGLNRHSRVGIVAYNPYFRFLYSLASKLGIRKGPEPDTFVTFVDLENIAKLAGYDLVRSRPAVYIPWKLFGIGDVINKIIPAIPLLNYLSLVTILFLRPVRKEKRKPSLSIVIPARNEKGNIENALKRMPKFDGADIEVIYVEGHSSDDTWGEIKRVVEKYKDRFKLKAFQQTGKGKVDAVRLGFREASGELLTILDADLTMPPELLERFYSAYRRGLADFINGSRLVYPMEGNAMRPLNLMGNIFFAKALSFVLGNRLGDSLCGTKLLSKIDYERCMKWRDDFGDFDPFGDYELLFPASVLGLGIIDIPIRYRDRTYGSTNISRFRHGLMLLKMTLIGLFRIKLGKVSMPS